MKNKRYKAIIFDNAGVLIDEDHKRWSKAIADYYKLDYELVYQNYSRSETWPLYKHGKISEDEFWQMGNKLSGYQLDVAKLKNIVRANRKVIEKTARMIPQLKGKYKLGLLNNEGKEWDIYSRKKENFYQYFDYFMGSYVAGISKPKPGIYRKLIDLLVKDSIAPSDCLYIDDRQNNLDAGAEFGFDVLFFSDADKLRKDLISRRII